MICQGLWRSFRICDAIPIPIPIPYAININYFGLMTFATVTNYGIFVHAAVGVCVCVVYISTYINICALNNLSGLSNAQCTLTEWFEVGDGYGYGYRYGNTQKSSTLYLLPLHKISSAFRIYPHNLAHSHTEITAQR